MRKSRVMARGIAIACGIALIAGATALAGEDPEPEEVLRQASEYVRGLKTFRVDVTSLMKVQAEGIRQEYTSRSRLVVARPGRVASLLTFGLMGGTVVCDGRRVYRYVPMLDRYSVEEAPDDIADVELDVGAGMMGSAFPLMGALVAGNPAEVMLAGVVDAKYVKKGVIDGAECHVVRFTQEYFSWEAWIQAGKRPLLRRVVPDLSGMMEADEDGPFVGMPGLRGGKYELSFDLDAWEENATLSKSDFDFTPPSGAKKVGSLPGRPSGVRRGRQEPPGEDRVSP